ncbi:hypothetical protein AVEN_222950-1, partial [Araneus ventricosus]
RATGPIHDGPSVESGLEPGVLRLSGRHLITRTPRPQFSLKRYKKRGIEAVM